MDSHFISINLQELQFVCVRKEQQQGLHSTRTFHPREASNPSPKWGTQSPPRVDGSSRVTLWSRGGEDSPRGAHITGTPALPSCPRPPFTGIAWSSGVPRQLELPRTWHASHPKALASSQRVCSRACQRGVTGLELQVAASVRSALTSGYYLRNLDFKKCGPTLGASPPTCWGDYRRL